MQILLIDDNDADQMLIEMSINKGMKAAELSFWGKAAGAAEAIASGNFDCVLLDNDLPGGTGVEILSGVAELLDGAPLPAIIMLTGTGDEEIAVATMKAGAVDYLRKDGLQSELLCHTIQSGIRQRALEIERDRHLKMLAELALKDSLTGLGNRQAFHTDMKAYLARATRREDKLALLMIDMNGLKQINDELGHLAGDMMIKTFAQRLSAAMRDSDGTYRVGGDEFVAIIEYAGRDEPLERILERIAHKLRGKLQLDGREIEYSASLGAARFPEHGRSTTELFDVADRAMYQSKRGRLPFVIAAPPSAATEA